MPVPGVQTVTCQPGARAVESGTEYVDAPSGAVAPTEEDILGDEGGTGVVDQEGYDQAQPQINPQHDPFAYSSGRAPPRR